MGASKQRIFIESPVKLKNGLHDGIITKAGMSGKYKRVSLDIHTDRGDVMRIDFELEAEDYDVCQDNKRQLNRIAKITCGKWPHDTQEFVGKRIGVRIDRSRFVQFESPLFKGVAQ